MSEDLKCWIIIAGCYKEKKLSWKKSRLWNILEKDVFCKDIVMVKIFSDKRAVVFNRITKKKKLDPVALKPHEEFLKARDLH